MFARPFRIATGFALGIVFFVVPIFAHAYTSPGKPTGFVNDFSHVLSSEQSQAIEIKLLALQKATGDEAVVVTVPSLGDETIESYAVKLFQEWGIGNKDTDTGLLILVSTGDHKARIEVGYGLEGTVTDLQSGNIIRKIMIPAFKEDDYAGGISGGVDAITEIITGSPDALQYSAPADDNSSSDNDSVFAAVFFFGFIVLNALTRILGRTRSWWLGGVLGAGAGVIIGLIWGFFFVGIAAIVVLTILGLIFDFIVSKFGGGPGRPGGGLGGFWPLLLLSGRGGRGGSGGGGGGFGGFGGGSSGGGGASGSW